MLNSRSMEKVLLLCYRGRHLLGVTLHEQDDIISSGSSSNSLDFCFTMIADIAMMHHGELTVAHLVAVVGHLDLLQRVVSPGAHVIRGRFLRLKMALAT